MLCDLKHHFVRLTNSMGQNFQKVAVEKACLCSVMSGTSPGKSESLGWLDSWSLKFPGGSSTHVSGAGCCCQLAHSTYVGKLHMTWASLQHGCFKGAGLLTLVAQGPKASIWANKVVLCDLLWAGLRSHTDLLLLHFLCYKQVIKARLEGRGYRPHLLVKGY